ncbi:hypothetical protein ACIGCM_20250 [Pseudomonas sp. NPDC078700]|uniref:hypothetical protein n=1 Tax=Pseudomonas sp. NPDC078700 TaxID=3364424 RepID=UPI0037C614BC
MKDLNAMQQTRTALLAEQEELNAQLPELLEIERTAPKDWNYLGHAVSTPEGDVATQNRMDVSGRVDSITSAVKRLDQDIAYLELLEATEQNIAQAKGKKQEAHERVERILASTQRITETLAQIHSDEELADEQARLAEQEAAELMAKATASGDSKASKAAQIKMDEAIKEAHSATKKREHNQPIIRALESESTALEELLATARKEESDARSAERSAMRTKLGAQWDEATAALKAIGVELVTQDVRYPLTRLHIPTFAPGNVSITHDDLLKIARSKTA